MTISARTRQVNPRLGTYFGIFTSSLAALVVLAIIFENLGMSDATLRWTMLLGPIALYSTIAVLASTSHSLDYFAAGRRVPSVYTGLILAVSALGASGLAALTGVLFVAGFDGLAFMIGGLAGFVVMAVLLAPFLRKFGAYTLPTYLGRRFESRALRLLAAGVIAVPMLLIISAELLIGARFASWLSGAPVPPMLALLSVCVLLATVPGGLRSLSWSSAAQAIAVLITIIVAVAIVALLMTKIPIPQLSYGPIVRSLIREEAALAMPDALASPFAMVLPGDGYVTMMKRFVSPFATVGPGAFVVTVLTVMAGFASAPWLLPRVSATPGVYDARKSLGWATLFFGLLFLTMTSVAAFLRAPLMDLALQENLTALPDWLVRLKSAGLVQTSDTMDPAGILGTAYSRDFVLLALPVSQSLPHTLIYLVAAAVVAASLTGAGAAANGLANLIAEDVVGGLTWEPPSDTLRLLLARVLLAVVIAGGAGVSLLAPTDPLKLLHWALVITAATSFPVLVLSIWWKRSNGYGAAAGMAVGFAVAVGSIVGGEVGLLPIAGPLAAAAGIPLGTIVAMVVSALTPAPSRHALELVRDIRVPGGEILYDREMQRLRLKQRRSAA
ncbi:MAG: sodium:solute symporter [Hyphomicrobiaceae bacterium]|nr:sodium:solute symporter [Hyphomicrobiaceae bacterium]